MISQFVGGGMVTTTIAIVAGLIFGVQFPPVGLLAAGVLGGVTQATSQPRKVVYVRR